MAEYIEREAALKYKRKMSAGTHRWRNKHE